ncbi:hypothetical protein OESDEN_10864 [Oesophagostomum dentatum]|uniref:Uncharacterized protein n=1 Tax=Oesophagostomum dentatum TaxID=61180 RepID=A0A0B1T1M4_OESDE|nr:hypothetical protein OESDEN_10864 [Oesophagostomum dentatum]
MVLLKGGDFDVVKILEDVDAVSEAELFESPIIRMKLGGVPYGGFRNGIRNKAGSLLILHIAFDICIIYDPYVTTRKSLLTNNLPTIEYLTNTESLP